MRRLGVRIAIDDFGTGHSSLSYLRSFPVDILKIDRSFISELVESSDGESIAGVIVGLGRTLQLHVIAEGVEEEHQLATLRAAGCDAAQGFFLGRPMDRTESRNCWRAHVAVVTSLRETRFDRVASQGGVTVVE